MALDEGHRGGEGGGGGASGRFVIEITTSRGVVKCDNAHEAVHELMDMMMTGDEALGREGFGGLCAISTAFDIVLMKTNQHAAVKFATNDEDGDVIILVKKEG